MVPLMIYRAGDEMIAEYQKQEASTGPLLLNLHFQTSVICCIQSMHMILTAFVARTELPQQGH